MPMQYRGACKPFSHLFYYWLGIAVQAAKKIKHCIVSGYTSPRSFSSASFEQAVEHDVSVVARWTEYLSIYTGDASVKGKKVLELGPGPDLGTGMILVWKGAKQYTAVDAYPLALKASGRLYELLLEYLEDSGRGAVTLDFLRASLHDAVTKRDGVLRYCVDERFTFNGIEQNSADIVFSNAAFEHFDDVAATLRQLSRIVVSGGVLIALIDLLTHHPWLRARDPLNIYRYSKGVYNCMRYEASPNRVRPHAYEALLKECGWKNVCLYPLERLPAQYMHCVAPRLDKQFWDPQCTMDVAAVMLCAARE